MSGRALACVEIGGSGVQTVVFRDGATPTFYDELAVGESDRLAIAVPGYIVDGRVVGASNLDWFDVDPAEALGLSRSAELVLNDAEAAALGEAALRSIEDVTFVGLGTGVGGAVVQGGRQVAGNLFGHMPGFSAAICPCGETGCLETVAAGWSLPPRLSRGTAYAVGEAVAQAIRRESTANTELVVLAGGLARAYPRIVDTVRSQLVDRIVEPSAAPAKAKSAAAWGLRAVLTDNLIPPTTRSTA